jgi:hypothetical protein
VFFTWDGGTEEVTRAPAGVVDVMRIVSTVRGLIGRGLTLIVITQQPGQPFGVGRV